MAPTSLLRDPDALLTHGDFVRALARSLLDEHRADDVVQETWLAALERPPRSGGRMRAWLAVVAKNFATRALRSDGRRARREAAAARPERIPSTADVVEREAARRRVVEAVLALAEPYRSAVLLRYFEGLSPAAIADRLGVPVGTVATRLKRALERLRLDLDREHGGNRGAWSLALAPFAVPAVAEGAAGGAVAGVLAMNTAAKVAAAALLLGGGAAVWVSTGERQRGKPDAPMVARVVPGESHRVPVSTPSLPSPPDASAAPADAASAAALPAQRSAVDAARVEVSGRVFDDRGAPIAGARVAAAGNFADSDGNGEFRLALPATGDVEVGATHPDHFDGRVARPGDSPEGFLDVRLERKLSISGVVLGRSGNPVVGATVRAAPLERGSRIALGALLSQGLQVRPRFENAIRELDAGESRTAIVRLRLDARTADGDEVFVARQGFTEHRSDSGFVTLAVEPTVEWSGVRAKTDLDGRFVLAPMRAGRWRLDGDARCGPIDSQEVDLDASRDDLELRALGGRIWVEGIVRDCRTGEAIAGAAVVASARAAGGVSTETVRAGDGSAAEPRDDGRPKSSGAFSIPLWARAFVERPPARIVVGAAADGFLPAIVEIEPGAESAASVPICLERAADSPGSIEAEVVFDDGESLDGPIEFRVSRPSADGPEDREFAGERALVATGGSVVVPDLPAGDWIAFPRVPGFASLDLELARVVRVPAVGSARARWTIPRGGRIALGVNDEEGTPVAGFTLHLENDARRIEIRGDNGRALLAGIPAGTYRLSEANARALEGDAIRVVAGEVATVSVVLAGSRGG